MPREKAEQIADAILRGRKLLKWLLADNADGMGPVLHEFDVRLRHFRAPKDRLSMLPTRHSKSE